ncbi:MAG: PhoX family phosphatase, partial [Alphaproteobacteria bacterium]|nr:PhoX family phosphatase [Alphaproteobacteria bacterium]
MPVSAADVAAPTPHVQTLISRRGILGGLAALPMLSLAGEAGAAALAKPVRAPSFKPVAATWADAVTVPEGYVAKPLIAWGDALVEGLGPFNPAAVTRAEQEQRFGQNNDMLAIFPAEWTYPKATDQNRFLLCANHEYFDPAMHFPGKASLADYTAEDFSALYAALGVSVVQIARGPDGAWSVVRDPKPGAGLNRRITPFTPVVFSGPAGQHPWIVAAGAKVNAIEPGAPEGAIACGTHSNCAGGETPWGTYLTSEENFNSAYYNTSETAAGFSADPALVLDAENFGYPLLRTSKRRNQPAQFDLAGNPTGPSLYGWVVEIDPYDPTFTPRKRTALGRKKGECATTALCKDMRVAVYMGDDQVDEFIYKFVTKRRFNPKDRIANRTLLDDGTLYVAKLHEDGTGEWLPLTVSRANAAAKAAGFPHPFKDQADVVVRAREAARLMGATPMDRPEDVEAIRDANWVGTGAVLAVMTKNPQQGFAHPGNPRRADPDRPDKAQPNLSGHILRFDEARGCGASTTFTWGVFLLGGDPNAAGAITKTTTGLRLHTDVSVNGTATFTGDRFACPDNIAFDAAHNVWIATDGSPAVFEGNDQVLVTTTAGPAPREVRRFLVGPVGSEICGPMLAPDDRAFFCAIQHPGESDTAEKSFNET